MLKVVLNSVAFVAELNRTNLLSLRKLKTRLAEAKPHVNRICLSVRAIFTFSSLGI